MNKTIRNRYFRLLKGAIRMNDNRTQLEIKKEIIEKYNKAEFFSLECDVLEELKQFKVF
jgi:predicted DNA-binding protein